MAAQAGESRLNRGVATGRQLRDGLIRRLGAGAIVCAAVVTVCEFAVTDIARQTARAEARDQVNALRVSIQQLLNRDIQLIRGMMGYVRARPDLSQAEFELIAQDILEGAPDHIRNLALARDLVISHMHPLAGNEAAVGLDYRRTPDQWEAVRRVVEQERIVLAGPLDLKQGGTGLIARFPIHLRPDRDGIRALWGISSTVIDFQRFLDAVGYPDMAARYDIALAGRDGVAGPPAGGDGNGGDDAEGEPYGGIFWGDGRIVDRDPVVLEVILGGGGSWRLLAVPRDGWPLLSPYLPWFVLGGLAAFGLFAVWAVARYRIAVERNEADRAIIAALERAEAASAAKSSFMAVMSHELRTPLNAIIGFAELLERQPRDGPVWERAPEYVSDIRRSGQFLLAIINDILDLSRIESGRYDLRPERVDLAPLLHECVRRVARELETAAMTVSLPPADRPVAAFADPRAVRQILTNLISNALKYAGPGTSLALDARPVGDERVELTVADDGVGVPRERIADILEPFVQVSPHYTRSAGGTGLGLAICRSLTRAMGGATVIESDTGKGLTARILLPSVAPKPADD